jgi:antitoxin VapB
MMLIPTFRETTMPLQIANPAVVGKVERLAKATGLSKTAAVEHAVDRLLGDLADVDDGAARAAALLAQIDRIPERSDAFDPLAWDEQGLPA